jgi:hypothetical protein
MERLRIRNLQVNLVKKSSVTIVDIINIDFSIPPSNNIKMQIRRSTKSHSSKILQIRIQLQTGIFTSPTIILSVPIRITSPIPPSRFAISIFNSSCWAFQFLIRDSSGCRALRVDAVDAGPWERVSWTMGTTLEPVVDLRVVGTDEEGGMSRSSFDCDINCDVRETVPS